VQWQDFIVDIDTIQSHGIGAADITKLKVNGYYTVAVSIKQLNCDIRLTVTVCPRCNEKDAAEDQGLQRGQSRESQRSNTEMPGIFPQFDFLNTKLTSPYSLQHQAS
jgi:RNA polymerase subunit RPABC4/transcription elongation factor Spt4